MRDRIAYTLLGDGTSDRVLTRVISWLLADHTNHAPLTLLPQFSAPPPASGLGPRIQQAMHEFPCEMLLVHRDAEAMDPADRRREIESAFEGFDAPPHVCVIPVKMTEAWLLLDPGAIRRAADNPNGRVPLELPRPRDVEAIHDPKALLDELLLIASEKSGRRLAMFKRDLRARVYRVAEYTDSFVPLRSLASFRTFEAELRSVWDLLLR